METRTFKTEVSQLLDLVINSLYSKKEIFLRELVSNASDAIDRARYEGLTNPEILADGSAFQISITPDKAAKTLVVEDNGIGMSAEEVENNLGTIASSGTKAFLQSLKDAADKPEMIGRFGVGFYAAFMVASKVEVETRRVGSPAVRWVSSGTGTYEIGECDRETRGTKITLHMNDAQTEFLESWRIDSIVRKYSDFVAYPIVLMPDLSDPLPEKKEGDKEEPKRPDPRTLNSMKPIWKRAKDELKDEDVNEFYKHISHDYEDPLASISVSAEGATEFKALLFLPKEAPYDLFLATDKRHGLQLYVRGVFIGDDIEAMLPNYLRFVKGVVESSDLPLNVSREMLQDDAIVRRIRKTLVSRILKKLEEMKKDKPEDFDAFYGAFGRCLKEGLHEDYENADKLKDLVAYPSTFTEGEKRTFLKDYVDRMKPEQKDIYTLSADSLDAARNSPLLEAFAKHGYEVLFQTDPIDEYIAPALQEYAGKKLRAIDRGEIDLDGDDEKKRKKADEAEEKRFAPLFDAIKARLADTVKEVRISHRLTDSACCLVADEYGPSARMERILRAMRQEVSDAKRTMEINPAHPLAAKLLAMAEANKDDPALADAIDLLEAQALLSEGSPIKNPARFSKLLSDLMAKA